MSFFSTKDKEPLKIERQFSLYISKCQTSQKAAEINLQETSGFRTKAVNNLSLYFPLRSNKQVCSHMERCSHKKKNCQVARSENMREVSISVLQKEHFWCCP